jgi:hypothetical protein
MFIDPDDAIGAFVTWRKQLEGDIMCCKRLITSILLLGMTVVPAMAWNDEGHMVIAAVAYDNLTASAKTRVANLLALSRYPVLGNKSGVPSRDAAKAAFMQAATAPDAIKKPRYRFKCDGLDAAAAPDAARNIGFEDKNIHKYWHFTDVPFSTDGTPAVKQPPIVNIQERIALFRKVLASDATDDLKAYDLVWLIHLVGDIHQPLHVTSRFTRNGPKGGDLGGIGIKVRGVPRSSTLHAFWNNIIGENDEAVKTAIDVAHSLPPPDDPVQAASMDEAVWVNESVWIAKNSIYRPPVGAGPGPFRLDEAYRTQASKVAQKQAALAGFRLAKLINDELK